MSNLNIFDPPENTEESGKMLADHMPVGKAWDNKNVPGTNINSLVKGISIDFLMVQEKIFELSQQFDINLTTDLLPDWETSVGIPDQCVFELGTLSERRAYVLSRFAKLPIVSKEDFENLALQMTGLNIMVEPGQEAAAFPITFPFVFGIDGKEKFTMVITFLDLVISTFPFTFPFVFVNNAGVDIIKCVFEKIKPSNVNIIYTQ